MRLRKFRVRAFRCIHDSGEIKVGDLAAFIGRNESGKTTILEALTLLNKEAKVSDLDLCDEMSEELKSEMRIVEGEFELGEKEIKLIQEKFPNLADIKKIRLYRTQKNPKVQYDFGDVKISEDANKRINSWENFVEKIQNFVSSIPNPLRIKIDTKFL
ncbi:MAG: AAA family ATPase [Nitrosopumilaceae archaeon]